MKIKLLQKYLSLEPFESQNLPRFTAIIGKNGCGKTQLMNLLASKKTSFPDFIHPLDIDSNLKVGLETLNFEVKSSISTEKWYSKIQSDIMPIIHAYNISPLLKYIFDKNLSENMFNLERKSLLSNSIKYLDLLTQEASYGLPRTYPRKLTFEEISVRDEITALIEFLKERFGNNSIYYQIPALGKLAAGLNKKVNELTNKDLQNGVFDETLLFDRNSYSQNIEDCFFGYAKARHQNRINYGLKITEIISNEAIPDSEFVQRFPPPWVTLNQLLEDYKLNFRTNEISKLDFSDSYEYSLRLYNALTGVQIGTNLSSGEQVIFSLISKLFTNTTYSKQFSFPDLIIFDEPDSHLHPELKKLLIDVLYNTYVKKLGIKVIITTHSPTTVALVPEASIFELKNFKNSSLTKIKKDSAIKILTTGIPTLSIDYKNHKQVFVESPMDLDFYNGLANIHFDTHKIPQKVYFLSSGFGKSNCDSVIKVVKTLRDYNSNSIYGIIDWDNTMRDKCPEVFVHGENFRYSIENYMFDPIYIFYLLYCSKYGEINEEFKIKDNLSAKEFFNVDSSILQSYSDYVINDFENTQQWKCNSNFKGEIVDVLYQNGVTLRIPKKYLMMNGHKELDPMISKAYNDLRVKYSGKRELENKMIEIMISAYPLVPNESITLIETLNTL